MTESEWNSCTDPMPMLEWLVSSARANERKLRLTAVAAARRLWHRLSQEVFRNAVLVGERHADGLATLESLKAAEAAAWAALTPGDRLGVAAASCAISRDDDAHDFSGLPAYIARQVFAASVDVASSQAGTFDETLSVRQAERIAQCHVLREIVGPLPFRDVCIDRAWLAWNRGTVVKLSEAAYAERLMPSGSLDDARLAVLADALEEAGCDSADLLDHLRQQGAVHVRGCWVVDLLLGKS